ncbi:MAG: beta-1,6-N-acetylglucosaminyltransferase [Treponemataceae bacterium]|nr:MAG: beta-1,6-N-acetylglucosaminyltransferase [Treponemataceae bacterium]
MLLVHKNEAQVNRLIKHLSKDFDVYVHIDKNSSIKILNAEKVFVYKKYKTYWGSFNQIMATLYLLKKAYSKGYDRYLLISGQDLPIRSNAEIKDFFKNNEKEYVDIAKIPRSDGWPCMTRLTKYHPSKPIWQIKKYDILSRCLRKMFHTKISIRGLIFEKITKNKYRPLDYDFYGGANWTNFTHNCVKKIFEYFQKDKKYIQRFRWTICADEIFYQTIIHKIAGLDVENNCLRYIDWENGPEYPRTLRMDDYEKIMQSNGLFARKFDVTVDTKIVDKIYEKIGKEA